MEHAEKENVEFRYYEMPQGMPVLALLGEKWITESGDSGSDSKMGISVCGQ